MGDRQPTGPCKHCGKPTREGEALVNWPWIHEDGFYRCTDGQGKAEPKGQSLPIARENEEVYKREADQSFAILQENRHRSVPPYEWFGPSPEPRKASVECECQGCVARWASATRLLDAEQKRRGTQELPRRQPCGSCPTPIACADGYVPTCVEEEN